jgi:hypothetical protein
MVGPLIKKAGGQWESQIHGMEYSMFYSLIDT